MPGAKAQTGGSTVYLHTDGASFGNPGPAGAGIVLEFDAGESKTFSVPLGTMTNNQAEYNALILGLKEAIKLRPLVVHCLLDSELVVRQLNGEYKVRDKDLQSLYSQVRQLCESIELVTFSHVPREHNAEADKLSKRAARANRR